MTRHPRIKDWPYSPSEAVVLRWVRSPWQEPLGTQWRTSVTFADATNSLKSLDLPWGLLLHLRLGQIFINGFADLDAPPLGDVESLWLPDSDAAQLVPAGEILPPRLHPTRSRDDLRELLLCFVQGERIIVMPVVECLRALLAVNGALAHGLLEPAFFARVIDQREIRDGCLHLKVNRHFAGGRPSDPVILHLAQLLYDPTCTASWHHVFQRRFAQVRPGNNHLPWPLEFRLPRLASEWQVRALHDGPVTFVQEILQTQFVSALPFKHVVCTGPGVPSRRGARSGAKGRAGSSQGAGQAAFLTVDTSSLPSKRVREPRSIKAPPLPAGRLQTLRVLRQPTGQGGAGRSNQQDGAGKAGSPDLLLTNVAAVEYSLSAPRGPGPAQPLAEFTPEERETTEERIELSEGPLLSDLADGLGSFAAAMEELRRQHPEVRIGWRIEAMVPSTGSYAQTGGRPRKYALVRLRWASGATCWVLEFGRPDRQAPSTLLFRPLPGAGPLGGFLRGAVRLLLEEALDAGGSWQQSKIDGLQARGILGAILLKHYKIRVQPWSERIHRKASALTGANLS